MDARNVFDPELRNVRAFAFGEMMIPVVNSEHAQAAVDRLNRRGSNDAVDARRRAAANEDAQSLCAHYNRSMRAPYDALPKCKKTELPLFAVAPSRMMPAGFILPVKVKGAGNDRGRVRGRIAIRVSVFQT